MRQVRCAFQGAPPQAKNEKRLARSASGLQGHSAALAP